MNNILALNFWDFKTPNFWKKIIKDAIIDRWSRYTIVWWCIHSKEDIKPYIKELLQDSYFRKATHNTYAYRIELENGSILEWKNDDGETWAGMCILRELQRENTLNIIVIVTRYFWWIQLQSDRFKHVINATKIFLESF